VPLNAKCFFLESTDQIQRYLRRYTNKKPCPLVPGEYSYHDAMAPLDVVHESRYAERASKLNPDWPKLCACGYEFEPTDAWDTFTPHLYRRVDNGITTTLRDAPPGAMWYADWVIYRQDQGWFVGPDGHCLMIRGFYGRDFCPDQRARNCTLPDNDEHKCWVRVGEVPNITIGKTGGRTCGAGAGSFFFTDAWHGFCENGELVQR
jgi:hypothetical protein